MATARHPVPGLIALRLPPPDGVQYFGRSVVGHPHAHRECRGRHQQTCRSTCAQRRAREDPRPEAGGEDDEQPGLLCRDHPALSTTTPAATVRAAFSLTGAGNVNSDRKAIATFLQNRSGFRRPGGQMRDVTANGGRGRYRPALAERRAAGLANATGDQRPDDWRELTGTPRSPRCSARRTAWSRVVTPSLR